MAFGAGEIDNASLLRQLHEIGYNGFVVVEIEVEDKANTSQYVRDARGYLQHILDGLNNG